MNEPKDTVSLGVTGNVVLLFSGGVDSYIGRHWLLTQSTSFRSVYFDLGSRYTQKELTYIKGLEPDVVVDKSLQWLGKYERGEKAFVPYRNLFLAMSASVKYAPNVCICGLKDDEVPDKNERVFEVWSEHLSEIGRKRVKVFSPFWNMTKAEIVGWYLKTGGFSDALLCTVSCYTKKPTNYCGECPACFRKACALRVNGIDIRFYNTKLIGEYQNRALANCYDPERNSSILKAFPLQDEK